MPIIVTNVNAVSPEKTPINHLTKPIMENHSKKNFTTSKLKYIAFEAKSICLFNNVGLNCPPKIFSECERTESIKLFEGDERN